MAMRKAVFSLIVFIGLLSGCASGSRGAGDPLSVELANVHVVNSNIVDLDFIIKNNGPMPIYLYDSFCAWGAYQWVLHVRDSDDSQWTCDNRMTIWLDNSPETFEIAPGEINTMKVRMAFHLVAWGETYAEDVQMMDGRMAYESDRMSVRYPLHVFGSFSSPRENDLPIRSNYWEITKRNKPNWAGVVRTKETVIDQGTN